MVGAMLRCDLVRLHEVLVELRDARLRRAVAAAAERAAHALDAERDAALARADRDRLGDAVQRLHARAALAVGVERADLGRKAGEPRDVVGADAGSTRRRPDVAEADVLDHPRADLIEPYSNITRVA